MVERRGRKFLVEAKAKCQQVVFRTFSCPATCVYRFLGELFAIRRCYASYQFGMGQRVPQTPPTVPLHVSLKRGRYAKNSTTPVLRLYIEPAIFSDSTHHQEFADRLYADLQARGVRCWFAPEDLKTGDPFQERIERSIHL